MSSAYESGIKSTSVNASGDLSANQFLFHTIDSAGTLTLATSRGQRVHGVLRDDPAAAGRAGELVYGGIMQVTAGAVFQEGVEITTNASGQAIQATLNSDVVIGTSVQPGVSGERASIIIGVAGGYISQPGVNITEDLTGYLVTDLIPQRSMTGTIGTGTAADLNQVQLLSGTRLGLWVIGTQTIVTPGGIAGGVDIGYDQVENDGVEFFSNILPFSGAPMIAQVTPAFYFLCGFNIADVSGTDMLFCGFRKEETAYQGTFTGYNTYFGLGSVGEANPMELYVREEINGGAGAETDTTDTTADGIDLWVETKVSAAGLATLRHGATRAALAAPSTTSAFTFDTGDILVPTLRHLQANASQTGVFKLFHWEVGLQ